MNKTLKLVRGETLSFIRTTMYCSVAALTLAVANAGDNKDLDNKDAKSDIAPLTAAADKNWSTELSSGVLFSNVRTGPGNNYTLVPVQLAGILKVDDVSLDDFAGGIFRGNTEFLFRGDFYQVTFGQENHLAGLSVGPRYNFVQPGWKIVPFVEGTVGILFADSNPQTYGATNGSGVGSQQRGLGEDFNFTFGVAVGFRYDINEDWYLRASFDYAHVSNAGLSEPQWQNKAIDAVGPKIGVGYRF